MVLKHNHLLLMCEHKANLCVSGENQMRTCWCIDDFVDASK